MTYRCFELDPTMERQVDYTIYQKLADKYGMSLQQAKSTCQSMESTAREEGLDFNFETMKLTNTFDAHRLTMYAKKEELMHEMNDRILRAYYSEGKHIGEHSTLVELATDVGINPDSAKKILSSDAFTADVRKDEQIASQYGIRSIPFFLINGKYSMTGAQPTDSFVEALTKIYEQDGQDSPLSKSHKTGVSCDDDNGCER